MCIKLYEIFLNHFFKTSSVLNFLTLRVCVRFKREKGENEMQNFFQGKSLIQKRRSDQRIEANVNSYTNGRKVMFYTIYISATFYADLIFNTIYRTRAIISRGLYFFTHFSLRLRLILQTIYALKSAAY